MIEESFQGELSSDQQEQMLRVTFPDDRWPAWLHPTEEIEAAYRSWLATECSHDETGIRAKKIKGGGLQFVSVCLGCGLQYGGPIAKKGISDPDAVPSLGELSEHESYRRRHNCWRDQKVEFYERQSLKITKAYAEYLKSPEWKLIRAKVFARSQGICEGCGKAEASQVHHLSYEHRFEEFLWELVAVCNECHERAHPEKKTQVDG